MMIITIRATVKPETLCSNHISYVCVFIKCKGKPSHLVHCGVVILKFTLTLRFIYIRMGYGIGVDLPMNHWAIMERNPYIYP